MQCFLIWSYYSFCSRHQRQSQYGYGNTEPFVFNEIEAMGNGDIVSVPNHIKNNKTRIVCITLDTVCRGGVLLVQKHL